MKGLVGLLKPAEGRFELYGKDISALSADAGLGGARRRIGVLFQSGALIGSLTLAENVALPIREFSNAPEEILEELVRLKLAMVRLGGYGSYYPAELSGGMKNGRAWPGPWPWTRTCFFAMSPQEASIRSYQPKSIISSSNSTMF